ncbi:MAG TPA: competence protein CoiA family protein [Anaeromyxobacter sp.]|nr:competence protein CoiA family protein [Anaeromyxobacter sp.]
MPRKTDVLLAWARDRDGAKAHAGRLDAAARRARAPFTCLGCGEPLVARLGPIRARHFAHLPGSTCPLTAPETALHLDAKERLLALCRDAFAGARRISLVVRCPGCRRPAPRDLAGAGDAAVEEGAVGPLRADVLVLSRGRPALALEVKVTHALEPVKEAALSGAGVPAIEIDARAEWEREIPGGVEVVASRSVGFGRCAACAALARAEEDRARGGEAAEIAELEAYRARGLLAGASLAPRGGGRPGPPGRPDDPLSARDRADLARAFRCPDCGTRELAFGGRLVRHPCPSAPERPVAWRGYDGAVVALGWWRPRPRRARA